MNSTPYPALGTLVREWLATEDTSEIDVRLEAALIKFGLQCKDAAIESIEVYEPGKSVIIRFDDQPGGLVVDWTGSTCGAPA